MFSDAGRAEARRRRVFSYSYVFIFFLADLICLLFVFTVWSMLLSINHLSFSSPVTMLPPCLVSPSISTLRRTFTGAGTFMDKSQRSRNYSSAIYLCCSCELAKHLNGLYSNRQKLLLVLDDKIPQILRMEKEIFLTLVIDPLVALCSDFSHHGSSFPELSTDLLNIQPPVMYAHLPINFLSPPCRHSFYGWVVDRKKLGFSFMGPAHFGPYVYYVWPIFGCVEVYCLGLASSSPACFSKWSISRGGDLPSTVRPRFVTRCYLTCSFMYLNLHKLSTCRGLSSSFVLAWILGLVESYLVGFIDSSPFLSDLEGSRHPSFASTKTTWLHTVLISAHPNHLDLKGHVASPSSFKERDLLPTSSLWERSHPPSSLLRERTFPPISLSLRGEPCSVPIPRDRSTSFTALSSCVAVHTGPEDATDLVSMRIGGKGVFSKSQVKVIMWLASSLTVKVMLSSVDESGLKTAFVCCPAGGLHISPDNLSSFLKLVSLSVLFVWSNFLALLYAFGLYLVKLLYHVNF